VICLRVCGGAGLAPAAGLISPRRLCDQAGDFGGTVAELAEQRDDAEIRLMRALDEIPLPQ
jgi:hypothetical protein